MFYAVKALSTYTHEFLTFIRLSEIGRTPQKQNQIFNLKISW